MAELKNLIVNGATRANGDLYVGGSGEINNFTASAARVGELTFAGDLTGSVGGGFGMSFTNKRSGSQGTLATNVDFGWNWAKADGAGIALRSSYDSSNQGTIIMYARVTGSSPQTSQFFIYPNGTLQFQSSSLGTFNVIHEGNFGPVLVAGATSGTITLLGGRFYSCSVLTAATTFALGAVVGSSHQSIYAGKFRIGSTAVTVSWPSGITWVEGSPDTSKLNSTYEFSICDGVGVLVRT